MDIIESKMTTKRKFYIDGLRGLAMIVVVFYHSLLRNKDVNYAPYFVFSNPLNVALFFTITGYLFSTREGQFLSFLKHVLLRLVVPWLALGLFPYHNIIHTFPRLLSGELFWFMPALIVAEIVFFFIHKVCTDDSIIICGLTVSVLGLVLYYFGWLNYAMINRGLTIQWLFVFGLIIKKNEDAIVEFVKKRILLLIMLFVSLGMLFILCYPHEFYDLHYNRYYFIPLTWSIIILGILIVFTVFKVVKQVPKWLVMVGQNTLIIYLLHGRVVFLFRKIVPDLVLRDNCFYPLYGILETAIVCGLCLVLGLLANKYLPEVVGQKRMKV